MLKVFRATGFRGFTFKDLGSCRLQGSRGIRYSVSACIPWGVIREVVSRQKMWSIAVRRVFKP